MFDDIAPNCFMTCFGIMGHYKDFKMRNHRDVLKRRVVEPLSDLTYPMGFFDGAAQGQPRGVGCRILFSQQHSYNVWMGIEDSTNKFSELVVVWTCLFWANHKGIRDIQIFVDSRVVIDWLNLKLEIHSIYLQQWCMRIKELLLLFTGTSFRHIFRENNMEVDRLSKHGLGCEMGLLHFAELSGTSVTRTNRVHIF